MSVIKHHKVVAALPDPLESNSIYYVRVGSGFSIYVTNDIGGVVAYSLNTSLPDFGGGDRQLLFNDAGNIGTASVVADSEGQLVLNSTADTPPASGVKLFYKNLASRNMPSFVGPSGLDFSVQPFLARNKIGLWNPPGSSTTVPGVMGIATPSALGTATTRATTATSMATRAMRLGYVSTTSAGAVCGIRALHANWTIGTGTGLGGFTTVIRWVISDAAPVAGARMFVGMHVGTGNPTSADPAGLVNCVGVAQLSTSNNLHIVHAGSTTQPPIDLGPNFPADGGTVNLYELALFNSPFSNTQVGYRVLRVNTGDVADGVLVKTAGTQLPSSSTMLGFRAFRSNNASALAVGIDIVSVYIETDN